VKSPLAAQELKAKAGGSSKQGSKHGARGGTSTGHVLLSQPSNTAQALQSASHHETSNDKMDLSAYFSRDLDDDTKHAFLHAFGVNSTQGAESLVSMAPYFEYYRREMKSSTIFPSPPIHTHEGALQVFKLLKAHATQAKSAIPAPQGAAAALDLGVRALLMTACKTPGTFGGNVFNPVWKADETLAAFVDRVYPRWVTPVDDRRGTTVIALGRMTAHALSTESRIDIQWTDRLTDHLELLVGANWKTIYIFRYPCYLKTCLEALVANKPELDHGTAEALAL
jgi:hypothetical protein